MTTEDLIMRAVIKTAMYGIMNPDELRTNEYKRVMAALAADLTEDIIGFKTTNKPIILRF